MVRHIGGGDARNGEWDAGNEVTAYFLEWLEAEHGENLVVELNQDLRSEYVRKEFWKRLCGENVKPLWKHYVSSLLDNDTEGSESETDKGIAADEVDEIEPSTEPSGGG